MKYEDYETEKTIKSYFNTLKDFKPLSKKEEHELLMDYRVNNNLAARNKLINSNLRYACKLASAYRNHGLSFLDLISEANGGLIESIDKFDLSRDVKLISYSKWWIIQRMQSAIEKRNRMPETDIPDERESIQVSDDDDTVSERTRATRYDTFLIDDEVEEEEQDKMEFVEDIMSCLTERESDMVNMYFGRCGYSENTLDKIGKKYNLTKERVRQIIETSFKKLRTKSMLVDSKYLSR